MSAPVLWIAAPIAAGLLILFVLRERFAAWIGGGTAAVLAMVAAFIPIDVPLLLGAVSIKIAPAVQVFGRSFELNTADGPLLAIAYGLSALWFFGTEASGTTSRFVSLGLMIVALLTASIAVEPFLYAALLLEMAALLTIPLLVPLYRKAGRGVVRFLIYQTLAMPFILFSGWMLAGVEASPGDLGATTQAGVMLGLGFAFLFAIFPLYNWIPLLMEEASPYVAAFLLWALPTFTVIFALGFLDRYAWLRASAQFGAAMQFAGIFMAASAGIFAAMQRHSGRILGYAAIAETGLLIVLMSTRTPEIVNAIFLTLIPRGLALTVWSLSLAIVKRRAYSLRFSELQGLARVYPVSAAAMILAHLSMTGFPLLAGFPPRLVIWQTLAGQSLPAVFWILLGTLGLLTAALRSLAVLVMAGENAKWEFNETRAQAVILGMGVLGLFVLGMFPQISQWLTAGIPALFDHLQ
jgi:formate hydrogenlyase subunit 3/multisubunit Na+/H+ antiporter MnhD subunit